MTMIFSRLFNLKSLICLFAVVGTLWFSPDQLFSQAATPRTTTSLPAQTKEQEKDKEDLSKEKAPGQMALEGTYDTFKRPSLITQAVVLVLLSLLPFVVMILTPFLKIVIVLSLLRSAIGAQQAPPNQILNGVAFMLALFIMYPTGLKMYDVAQETINRLKPPESFLSQDATPYVIEVTSQTREPMRDFLKKNSTARHQALFYRMAYRILPEEHRDSLAPSDFIILVPSFITSQLKDAFEIGVLIYIPFFVIDLVTSNVLLAMGMMMLSPVTISMPLKLFLLVMLDGWTLLVEGLVNSFH